MKKYLTTAFAVIALFSCNKKETTTVSEAQSDSLQTSVGTAPDSTTPNTIKLAIEDSAGIYTQRLFLQKGQTYPLVTYQRNVQSMTGPDGKKLPQQVILLTRCPFWSILWKMVCMPLLLTY